VLQTPRARVNWTPCRLRMGTAVSTSQTPRKIMCRTGTHKLRLHSKLNAHSSLLFSSLLFSSLLFSSLLLYFLRAFQFSNPTSSDYSVALPDLDLAVPCNLCVVFLPSYNIPCFQWFPSFVVSVLPLYLCVHSGIRFCLFFFYPAISSATIKMSAFYYASGT
jgi:hypothetical protein